MLKQVRKPRHPGQTPKFVSRLIGFVVVIYISPGVDLVLQLALFAYLVGMSFAVCLYACVQPSGSRGLCVGNNSVW
jgi:hypothetical protein